MKRIVVKDVELDYTNRYVDVLDELQSVIVVADLEVEIDDEGNKTVVGAIAKESNEVFGVEAGERFDIGDEIDVDVLLEEYHFVGE